jgi:hypothetical protein
VQILAVGGAKNGGIELEKTLPKILQNLKNLGSIHQYQQVTIGYWSRLICIDRLEPKVEKKLTVLKTVGTTFFYRDPQA